MKTTAGSRLLTGLLVAAIRLLWRTWRVRVHNPEVLEGALAEGATVLAFWHGEQLPMVQVHANRGFLGMVSLSRDGALLANLVARLGYRVVRGSSSRGGVQALGQALREMEDGACPLLAVDGPRGPRQVPHSGAVRMSARSGRPVVYGVSTAWPCVRLPSWDRFVVPLPFARVDIAYGRLEPSGDTRGEISQASLHLGASMRSLAQTLENGGLALRGPDEPLSSGPSSREPDD